VARPELAAEGQGRSVRRTEAQEAEALKMAMRASIICCVLLASAGNGIHVARRYFD
jgi:hypothetical protein